MTHTPRLVLIAAALAASGCTVSEEKAPEQATVADNSSTTSVGGVTRQDAAAAEPPVTPMAAPAVIQSQPGPEGAQVDLLKVQVTGDILTVTMRCSSERSVNTESFSVDDISVIDDATAQRIGVLKDNAGKPLVSSPSPNGTSLSTGCEKEPGVIWAKFPAPPATSPTVSINFPGVGPFDGVPVTR